MMAVNKSIDCAGTNLDIYDGPVGILVSGGADSAILLYYLMKHTTDKIHIFTVAPNKKLRISAAIAPIVVEACIKLTGNTNIEHHTSYCEVISIDNLWRIPTQFIEEKRVRVVYDGTTALPPKIVTDMFAQISLEHDNRDPTVEHEMFSDDGAFYSPYINVDKKVITSMYEEEKVIETLFAITRSCAYDPFATHGIYENIKDPGTGHCGECWWCEEREWAFGRL